jgi:hypothetical protein
MMLRNVFAFLVLVGCVCQVNDLQAQSKTANKNPVYVDKQGILKWTSNNQEAAFFGVNYTTPFAYAYRAHKALNADLEKAIQQDVYHMARLGLDAFRVHVWDTEITDTLGNLLENDHLRLFDFLLAELKKRNIKTIITPIAFWGNGYPERDERTPGFSRLYGKGNATANDTAIRAQENYLQQFFRHVNPYTKLSYGEDPDVIAAELNNEPSHSGPKIGVTNYINRLAAATRSTGWSKPVYYNISQSPYYADAVAQAAIDGVSFQWYPSGLVAGNEVKGNYLPNVDKYTIPFDTIPAYRNKSRMVYEYDAADLLQSCMYPAMARSFREAGFQWATQFAYDPMALAYANTEYQTHYLNLAYTPSKAISLLIASEVFHTLPRLKSYGVYPADSLFSHFRVSYRESLSEMNTGQKFYYSNSTSGKPVNAQTLTNLAGVGNSVLVHYEGNGAYFLDKVEEGVWRLELMPDAIHIRDPFEKAAPDKEVIRIQWASHPMEIMLPDLGQGFSIQGLNEGNSYQATASANGFPASPGTYLLTRKGKNALQGRNNIGVIGLKEFVAPQPFSNSIMVQHTPLTEVTAGQPFQLQAQIAGIDTGRATLQISRAGGGPVRNINMVRQANADYTATIPADLLTPGLLNYRIIVQKGNEFAIFPGNSKKSPMAWDNYSNETWSSFVAATNGRLEIFNPLRDKGTARMYPSFRRNLQAGYTSGEQSGQLIARIAAGNLSGDHLLGIQHYFADLVKGRSTELPAFNKLIVRARTEGSEPVKAKVTLTDKNATSLSVFITLTNEFKDIEVPLAQLLPDSALLMPRPYPGFQPLLFKGAARPSFNLQDAESIEITIGSDIQPAAFNKPYSLEVASVWFEKTGNH